MMKKSPTTSNLVYLVLIIVIFFLLLSCFCSNLVIVEAKTAVPASKLPANKCDTCGKVSSTGCICSEWGKITFKGKKCYKADAGKVGGGWKQYSCDIEGTFGRGGECCLWDSAADTCRCPKCIVGSYSGARSSTCYWCALGTYCDKNGCSSCTTCADGYTTEAEGSTSSSDCVPCPKGTYSSGGSPCKNCSAGFYSDVKAAKVLSTCIPCPIGNWCPSGINLPIKCSKGEFNGQMKRGTPCQKCAPASFSDKVASTQCTVCPPKHASDVVGLPRMCPICNSSYFALANKTKCTPCRPGWWADRTGTTHEDTCYACREGTFSQVVGATSISTCKICDPGRYAPKKNSTDCLAVPPGHFSNSSYPVSFAVPRACKIGTVAVHEAQPLCLNCVKGRFNPNEGSASCQKASTGFYVPFSGAAHQIPCMKGATTDKEGEFICLKCPRGFTTVAEGKSVCVPCLGNGCTQSYSLEKTISVTVSATETSNETLSQTLTTTSEITVSNVTETISSSPSRNTETASFHHNSTTVTETLTLGSQTDTDTIHHNSTTISLSEEPTMSRTHKTLTLSTTQTVPPSTTVTEFPTCTPTRSVTHPPTKTHELSPSATQFSLSHTVFTGSENATSSSTHSASAKTLSISETFHFVPPPQPLGLSAAAQQDMEQANSVVSVMVSAAAAPAAMTAARSIAILQLVGCPEKNSETGALWSEDKVPFPFSLIPGFGIGNKNARFHRGAVTTFCVVIMAVLVVGAYSTEEVKKPLEINNNNNNSNTNNSSERKEESENNNNENTQNSNTTRSSSDDSNNNNNSNGSENSEKNNNSVEIEKEEEEEKQLKNKLQKDEKIEEKLKKNSSRVVSHLPKYLFSVIGGTIQLWAPQAGLVFATLSFGDILLGLLPIVIVFAAVGYYNYRIFNSIRNEGQGIFYTGSMIFDRRPKKKKKEKKKNNNKNNNNQKHTSSSSNKKKNFNFEELTLPFYEQQQEEEYNQKPQSFFCFKDPKGFLESPIGRFCIIGNCFWTRARGEAGLDAQKLLTSLGPHVQRYRGIPAVNNFLESNENPFLLFTTSTTTEKENEDSMLLLRQQHVADGGKQEKESSNKNNNNSSLFADIFGSSSSGSDDSNEKLVKKKNSQKTKKSSTITDFKEFVASTSNDNVETTAIIDWNAQESVSLTKNKKDNIPSMLAPHFLLISWICGVLCGFLSGIALARPETCSVIAKIICVINVISFPLVVYIRPFTVPIKNYAISILEGCVAITSILVVSLFLENDIKSQKLSALVAALQIVATLITFFASSILISSTAVRFIFIRLGKFSLVSAEDLWAKSQMQRLESEMVTMKKKNNINHNNDSNDNEISPTSSFFNKKSRTQKKSTTTNKSHQRKRKHHHYSDDDDNKVEEEEEDENENQGRKTDSSPIDGDDEAFMRVLLARDSPREENVTSNNNNNNSNKHKQPNNRRVQNNKNSIRNSPKNNISFSMI